VVLPHVPWQHLPSGARYYPASSFGIERADGRWVSDPWWATEGQKRHLLQLEFVDALLGELLKELERADLYERSLLVITADHGAAFWPGQTRRLLAGHSHPSDILRVPLFVKAPFQQTGRISDAPIETVDILPTALALLDVDMPWRADGLSAVADGFEGRERRVAFDMEGRRYEYGRDELRIDASLARMLERFGNADGDAGLFAAGRYGSLVGRSPSEFERRPTGGLRLELASEPFEIAEKLPGMAHARISGRFWVPKVAKSEHHVAIAVGDVIRAVAPTYRTGLIQRAFTLVTPEVVAASDPDDLTFHLVTGPPDRPVLQPAVAEIVPILKKLIHLLRRDPAGLAR
jgi:hypothetical protein